MPSAHLITQFGNDAPASDRHGNAFGTANDSTLKICLERPFVLNVRQTTRQSLLLGNRCVSVGPVRHRAKY
jgi:hypothetical protein